MASLTAELAGFVSGLALADVPMAAQAVARTGFADCFGVMIAGAREPVVSLVDREMAGADGADQASLIPSLARRNVADAALVNGVAAHVLDYDDVTLDGHPSAVLVPAILAQAEALQSSGSEMLTAYAAGYEVWAELLVREPVPLHQKGWHPRRFAAPSRPQPPVPSCAGSVPTKPQPRSLLPARWQAGWSPISAPDEMLPGRPRRAVRRHCGSPGTGRAHGRAPMRWSTSPASSRRSRRAGKPDLARSFDSSKKEWHLERQGLNLKRYPICYATHRAIDAAVELAMRHDLHHSHVERISVSTGEMQMLMLRNERPQTAFEAKFSMQFAMASSLVARNVGLSQLNDQFVRSPEVQALIPRVVTDDDVGDDGRLGFRAVGIGGDHHGRRRGFRERADRLRQGQQAAAAVARRAGSQVPRMSR